MACMEAPHLILELGLELGRPTNATPSGWLRAPGLPAQRFESYVQLIGALEELRTRVALARGVGVIYFALLPSDASENSRTEVSGAAARIASLWP